MREIKFRAWNPNYKTWCGASEGDWWLGIEYNTGKLVCIIDGKITNAPNYIIPQMFTGLKDKNGKEIYEGDILRTESGICEVRWYDNSACFRYMFNDNLESPLNYDDIEIIGNIYQNGNLLNN